jgi:hypothetical protein
MSTVAEHLQVAFSAKKDVTIVSPFRPPALPLRSTPFSKPAPPRPHASQHFAFYAQAPVYTSGGPGGFIPSPHRQLQATAQPFVPGAFRQATPPPAPQAQQAVVIEEATIHPSLNVRVYTMAAFKAHAKAESASKVPAAVLYLIKELLPGCGIGFAPSAILARALGHSTDMEDDGDARGGLFAGRSGKQRPERLLHHKVMSVLSRVTPQKYEELKVELLALPIRQADEEQLNAVVDVFFTKAVQEDKFSHLYAGLVKSIFDQANEEAQLNTAATNKVASPLTPATPAMPQFAEKTSTLAKNLRFALLTRCQSEFEKPYRLTPTELRDQDGKDLPAEEVAERKRQLKKRLIGIIRFVGELYLHGIVTDHVITHIMRRLLDQAAAAEKGAPVGDSSEDLLEVFVTLMNVINPRYEQRVPKECNTFVQVARGETERQKAPRIRFLLMNLVDLADRGWVEIAPGSTPVTPASVKGTSSFANKASGSVPSTPLTRGKTESKSTDAKPTSAARKNVPLTPSSSSPSVLSGKMPSRANTASQSFGNLLSTSESAMSSGHGSGVTSPAKAARVAKATTKVGGNGKKEEPVGLLDRVNFKSSSAFEVPSTVILAAVVSDSTPLATLDTAGQVRVADARTKAAGLLASNPPVRVLCERLGTLELDTVCSPTTPSSTGAGDAPRAAILSQFIVDSLTTRRNTDLRAARPAARPRLGDCPVVEIPNEVGGKAVVRKPWFSAATVGGIFADAVVNALVDGVFEDCPTFFQNVMEVETAAPASPLAAAGSVKRAVPAGLAVAALLNGVAAASADEDADVESLMAGLGRALKQTASSPVKSYVEAFIKDKGADLAESAKAQYVALC